jgi:hypothetical protein
VRDPTVRYRRDSIRACAIRAAAAFARLAEPLANHAAAPLNLPLRECVGPNTRPCSLGQH